MRNIFSQLKKPWVPALIGLVFVAIATGIVVYAWGAPEMPASESVLVSSPVIVVDQKAGAEVQVAEVTVDAPGVWVAVHRVTEFGVGNVWGAVRAREARTDLSVPMIISTLPDSEYAIVLYRDNGDDVFDRTTDSVYIDFETGARVEKHFRTFPQ